MQAVDPFAWADELGPEKVVHLYDSAVGLQAVLAIDNVACGPAIGGVRMARDVSAEEAIRLARAMTLKNAAAGLPHGGAKAVIAADPRMPEPAKERLVRAFAFAIRDLVDYIPGPDMGTDETCMAWVRDEIGRAVGLPAEIGGIPLDEIGATGFGLAVCAEAACRFWDLQLSGARVAVQGFGNVGRHAAHFLVEKGAVLVAASDSRGSVCDPTGLDVSELVELKRRGRSVVDHDKGQKADVEAVLDVECEIWIPAARPDVVRADNQQRLRTGLILQGANIPVTLEAERALHERGVLSVPDFIANAGGVICGSVEYHGGTKRQAFQAIEEKITENTAAVLEASRARGSLPREAAVSLARERVQTAQRLRRFHS